MMRHEHPNAKQACSDTATAEAEEKKQSSACEPGFRHRHTLHSIVMAGLDRDLIRPSTSRGKDAAAFRAFPA
jgi:hypothetical protein